MPPKKHGGSRRTQVFSAGYSKNPHFIEALNKILGDNKYKLYWRNDHWEIQADRRLTEEEKEKLKTRYDDTGGGGQETGSDEVED